MPAGKALAGAVTCLYIGLLAGATASAAGDSPKAFKGSTRRGLPVMSLKLDQWTAALYRFADEGTGGRVADLSPSGLDLKLQGAGIRDHALYLPGTAGARAVCENLDAIAQAFAGANGVTVEMWLSPGRSFMDHRPVEQPGAAPCSLGWYWGDLIISQVAKDTQPPSGFRLRYNPDVVFCSYVAHGGVEHARGPWYRAPAYLAGPLAIGSWHHLAFTWDEQAVRLYLDGVELATGNSPGFAPCSGPIVIGCDADGTYPFKGLIRELRISRLARPRTYFKKLFPPEQSVLRLPRLAVGAGSGRLTACLPRRHGNEMLLPFTKVLAGGESRSLHVWAAPGQVEGATFALKSDMDVKQLVATASDLVGPAGTIPAEAIDILLVKCVYLPGEGVVPPNMVPVQSGKKLAAKLLVHDDALVRVDLKKQTNAVRVFAESGGARYYDTTAHNPRLKSAHDIRDARTFQPVDLKAGAWQQFWIKLRMPADASPGTYRAAVDLQAPQVRGRIELQVEILPIRLLEPVLDYSIYYTARLIDETKLSPKQRARGFSLGPPRPVFPRQLARQLADMKDHGVVNPTLFQRGDEVGEVLRLLDRRLAIRRKAGMSRRCLYFGGLPLTRMGRNERQEALQAYRALASRYGYAEAACYVVDEPTLSDLQEHGPIFKQVLAAGIKTFCAVDRLYDEDVIGDSPLWQKVKQCLSVLVAGGKLRPVLAQAAHRAGMKIYSYGNPQALSTDAGTFRRNYGLALWKAGYDGAMDFAYNQSYGLNCWNDFDYSLRSNYRYRNDQGFALTTSDGVAATLAWEGFAAGINDVRYLSTLLAAIEEAKADPTRASDAAQCQAFVRAMDPSADLDELRRRIAEWIVKLARGITPDKTSPRE